MEHPTFVLSNDANEKVQMNLTNQNKVLAVLTTSPFCVEQNFAQIFPFPDLLKSLIDGMPLYARSIMNFRVIRQSFTSSSRNFANVSEFRAADSGTLFE
jgi:nucleoside 2-deoxyribosyltransferase